jgi:DNA-binding HxlR family transcriptional regulator
MAVKKNSPETLCPISRPEDIVGDRSTVLVLRELIMRNHRYDENGMVEGRAYRERPPRYEYYLTSKGQARREAFKGKRGAEPVEKPEQ